MATVSCELKNLEEIASFITIVQAHGGRILTKRTLKVSGAGSTRNAECVKMTAEVPEENLDSLNTILWVTRIY